MCSSHFPEKKVLDGVSLKVEPLDRLVIMGQSGSGKSTILRLILGILQPTAGEIFFKQFEISRLKRRKLQQVRTHMGMVYQYSALLSSRNVRDNIALPLEELTRKTKAEIDKIVDEKLELVGHDRVERPNAIRVERRHAQTGQPGPRPRDGSRADPLRRAFRRSRPGHQLGHRRINHQPDRALEGDLGYRHS